MESLWNALHSTCLIPVPCWHAAMSVWHLLSDNNRCSCGGNAKSTLLDLQRQASLRVSFSLEKQVVDKLTSCGTSVYEVRLGIFSSIGLVDDGLGHLGHRLWTDNIAFIHVCAYVLFIANPVASMACYCRCALELKRAAWDSSLCSNSQAGILTTAYLPFKLLELFKQN